MTRKDLLKHGWQLRTVAVSDAENRRGRPYKVLWKGLVAIELFPLTSRFIMAEVVCPSKTLEEFCWYGTFRGCEREALKDLGRLKIEVIDGLPHGSLKCKQETLFSEWAFSYQAES